MQTSNENMYDLLEILSKFLRETSMTAKERSLEDVRTKLEQDLAHAFRKQGEKLLERFKKYKGRFSESITDDEANKAIDNVNVEVLALFTKPVSDAIEAAMIAGGNELVADIGLDISFNLNNPEAQQYLNTRAAELVSELNDTSKEQLRNLLADARQKGWGYNKTADAIKDKWERFAVGQPQKHIRSRAHLIANAETGDAYEKGSRSAIDRLKAMGLGMEKYWQTVGDDRVSDGCANNEADGWIDADEPHSSGHMHPLRHPACRCTELYRRKKGAQ